jgi:hypothetical protein
MQARLSDKRRLHDMFMLVEFGFYGVVLFMLFGIYSKLDDLARAINRLTPNRVTLPKPSSELAP